MVKELLTQGGSKDETEQGFLGSKVGACPGTGFQVVQPSLLRWLTSRLLNYLSLKPLISPGPERQQMS